MLALSELGLFLGNYPAQESKNPSRSTVMSLHEIWALKYIEFLSSSARWLSCVVVIAVGQECLCVLAAVGLSFAQHQL